MKTTSQLFYRFFTKSLILLWVLSIQAGTASALDQSFKGYKYYTSSGNYFSFLTEGSCYYDTTPPQILKANQPFLNCYDVENALWSNFIEISDNCTPTYLLRVSQKDSVNQGCSGSEIEILRTFTVSDRAGNESSATIIIFVQRVKLEDVVFPSRIDWYCPSIKTLDPKETGIPSYNGHPVDHFCGITLNYKDFATKVCGTSSFIRRHWTITDCCTLYALNYDQDIYIHDTTKPILTCPAPLNYSTNVKECYSHQIIPSIGVSDACNPDGLDILVKVDGEGIYRVGKKAILSVGNHTYEYLVTDACGNTSSCKVPVTVVDGQPPLLSCLPVDVCLETETIELCAKDFVSEYWDDCSGLSNVTLEVRKLDGFCNYPGETSFGKCVTICCIGNQKVVLVEIKATDKAGNSVTCVTEVNVTSKLPFKIKCTDTVRLSCGDPIPGTPAEVDYCGDYSVTIKTIFDNRNVAGMGTLIRRYIVTTADGRKDSCQTVIIIGLGKNAFGADDVTCPPANVDINGCIIPDLNSIPGIGLKDTARPCAQVNITLKLDTFTNLGTPCIRVRRTWTITDALQPALNVTCVQNININDTEKPVISGVRDTTVNAGVNCTALIDLPAAIATDCDPNVVITNSLNAQGANIAPISFPIGMTTIRYRATDKCGNKDSITIKITVVSTGGFSISCQPDTIVNCGVNFVPRAATINASCTQIASNVLRSDTVRNKCAITKINFKRIITDTAGRKDSCTFMVTFRTNDTLFCDQIKWAKDTTLISCNKSIHPDSINLRPMITFTPGNCARLVMTFKDSVITPGCNSVTRRIWEVSDTCAVPPVVCRDTQLITVTDNSAPILKIPRDTMVFLRAGFPADTLLTFLGNATATDCDPNVVIKNVIIGKTDTVGASLVRRYPLGTTNVLVIARDACGNMAKDTLVIQVKDTVKPLASCKKSNNYLSDQGIVRVKAKQFDGGSSDNATLSSQLRFSWTKRLSDTVLEVNCNVIKLVRASGDTILDSVKVFPFERNFNLWVTDGSGNQDTCIGNRFLAFFDTLNVCGKAAIRTNSAIQGRVTAMNGASIPNVILSAIGEDQKQNTTDKEGKYLIKGITPGMYKIFPYKNDDPMLGVSTADLISIQKHILGQKKLDGTDKMVAADVNNDGDISIIDLLELKKLILGIYDQFPQNTSWRFFDQNIMARVTDHLALKDFEKPFVEAKKEETALQNFTGIKVGDVNGSALPQFESLENRSRKELKIILPALDLEANQMMEIPVSADLENIEGLQGEIQIANCTILGIKENSGWIGLSSFKIDAFTQGILRFSWVRPLELKGVKGNQPLFTVYVRSAIKTKLTNTISINTQSIRPEAYSYDLDRSELKLTFDANSKASFLTNKFLLTQNAPNPFSESTVIRYSLPAPGSVNWSITDMAGRTIKRWNQQMAQGDHQVTVRKTDLGTSGIYYYRIEYNGYSEVKKLILLE